MYEREVWCMGRSKPGLSRLNQIWKQVMQSKRLSDRDLMQVQQVWTWVWTHLDPDSAPGVLTHFDQVKTRFLPGPRPLSGLLRPDQDQIRPRV